MYVYSKGICVWFTGLSGSGKSTTARALNALLEEQGRRVTFLDGDEVRAFLSKGLGFSKDDRNTHVRRMAFVASEVVKHGGLVVCAAISPYRSTRSDCRRMLGHGHFVEVFVDTPLEVCEARDPKGLYAKARRGELAGLTGVDAPYEPPLSADLVIDTLRHGPGENAATILQHLAQRMTMAIPARL
jgi:sulfate adenylyltransferase